MESISRTRNKHGRAQLEQLSKVERSEYYHDERLFEIQLLRRRIEKLRETLFGPQRSIIRRDEKVQESQPSVDRTQKTKDDELNDIKAKLLGRKK